MNTPTHKAVFLDRDGVVNEDRGYVHRVEDVALVEGIAPALRDLQEKGYLLVIVTNQSGVGRGMYTVADVEAVNAHIVELLTQEGVEIAGVFYCPHKPDDACECRKPAPGMILEAAEKFSIDLAQSYMVGDKDTDIEAGKAAGCKTIFVGEHAHGADFVVQSVGKISSIIAK